MDIVNKQKTANGLGRLFLYMIIFNIVMSVLLSVAMANIENFPMWFTVVVSQGAILIPALIYIKKREGSIAEKLGIKKIKPATIVLSLLFTLAVWPIFTFANIVSQFFVPNTMIEVMEQGLGMSNGTMFLVVAIIGPIFEEVVFRGVFNKGYKGVTSAFRAGLISALFFGIVHMNLNQMSYAFVIGFAFAMINTASGSLWTSIIMHITINAVNMLMLFASQSAIKVSGENLAEVAETIRIGNTLYIVAAFYFVLSIFGFVASIPCLEIIAKKEGRLFEYRETFLKKSEKENEENARVLLNIPTIVAIIVGVCIIVGSAFVM